ncbi:MAG: CPBP family intramembrane metalloprotease [Chloroflexi bacterium]|nr:CPBP family intramembrane metalloprotease [Chloroflexota bacterium]
MGVGGFLGVLIAVNVVIVVVMLARGEDFVPRDVGDTFEKAAEVARYADERLEAAANGMALPDPPRILADQGSLQVSLIATLISQGALFAIVGIASKQTFRGLVEALGLNRIGWAGMWLPMVMMAVAYLGVILWSIVADASGISWLRPTSTVPIEITRDDLTLSIAAVVTVVGAPLSEELFFRGLVFSGLLKWGFWPAATASGLMFAAVHFDPGSIVPFFMIGVTLSWVYYRRRSLWDAIVLHLLFNMTSLVFMLVVLR